MADARKFWMVSGHGPSCVKHDSRDSAEREAKRLARENPEQWFYVVEAVSAHRKNDVESVTLRVEQPDDDGIPF